MSEAEAEISLVYYGCSLPSLGWNNTLIQGPSSSKAKNYVSAEERKQKKQKRKVAEGQLQVKRQAMDKAKVRCSYHRASNHMQFTNASKIADAVKRYSYLLGQTELFKHFVDIKVTTLRFLVCDNVLCGQTSEPAIQNMLRC